MGKETALQGLFTHLDVFQRLLPVVAVNESS